MASAHYDLGLEAYTKGTIDLTSLTIKARLTRSSAYTFSQSHQFASSLAAAIVGDVTLGSKSVTLGTLDAADAVFASVPVGAAIDAVVLYRDTGVAGTSPLLCYIDGFSVTPAGGDITLQWAGSTPYIFKI